MSRLSPALLLAFLGFSVAFGSHSSSFAQQFEITVTGLADAEHTRDDGFQYSFHSSINNSGQVAGTSDRYNGGSSAQGRSAWFFDGTTTINVGLLDTEHTSSTGIRNSIGSQINEAGQVRGFADRYDGGSTNLGRSAFIYDGTTTLKIGFTDALHTKSNGYRYTIATRMNEAGQAYGYSERYNGLAPLGRTAWLYDGTSNINLGLLDAEHTSGSGSKYSDAKEMNEAGQVRGESYRYDSSSGLSGRSSWFYDGTTTVKLGYTDAAYTAADGRKETFTSDLNESGQVTGYSYRWEGTNTLISQTPWLYDSGNTITIGLTDTEHTKSGGYNSGRALLLNSSGQVAGFMERYNGGLSYLGTSAFFYDGSTSSQIGLTGVEHSRASGRQDNSVVQMNDAGVVLGYADRWNGGATYLGRSAWYAVGGTTTKIGLTDAEHTRNDDFQYSQMFVLQDSGVIAGSSNRYNGGATDLGQSTWVYDGSTTTEIGLEGADFVRDDGYRYSSIFASNFAGYIVGDQDRYLGSDSNGQSAWFYDPNTGLTTDLTLSVRSDGYAYSRAKYLGEDGMVIGEYTLFDEFDNDLGNRAFYFNLTEGLFDLSTLIRGGLELSGWSQLSDASLGNNSNQIAGYGILDGQPSTSQQSFVITAVPEPGTFLVLALFGLGLVFFSRHRNAAAA